MRLFFLVIHSKSLRSKRKVCLTSYQDITLSLRDSAAGKLNDCCGETNKRLPLAIFFTSIFNPGFAVEYNNNKRFDMIPTAIP